MRRRGEGYAAVETNHRLISTIRTRDVWFESAHYKGTGDPMLLDPITERLAPDAKLASRLSHIPSCQSQRLFDKLSLDLSQVDALLRKFHLQEGTVTDPKRKAGDVKPKGRRGNHFAVANQ